MYIYKLKYRIYCCYTFIEPHQWSYYSLIFYLFFSLFKLLFSILKKKKKKKKPLLLTISSQLQLYFLQLSLPSLPLYLLITLDFSVTLLSSFFFLYFDPSSPNIFFFVLNSISSLPFNPYFLPKIFEFSLSLSLSLSNFCSFL